jgi:predicted phosphodiesterase
MTIGATYFLRVIFIPDIVQEKARFAREKPFFAGCFPLYEEQGMRYHCGMKESIKKTFVAARDRCVAVVRRYWPALAFVLIVLALFFVRFYHIDGRFSAEVGNPRDSLVTVKSADFMRKNVPFFKRDGYAKEEEKIGWITDIHADRFKRRSVESGTVYPRQYEEYVPKIFDALRAQGIDTVVTTGDNVNSGDDNYGRALEKIAQEKHMRVIWIMGNHDSDESMAMLGVTGSKYFFTDYGDTRIIAIDDVEPTRSTGDYEGGIDAQQLDWLRGALKTDRQVIIAMHIPIFPLSLETVVLDRYAEFEKILHESGNVKMVISGHFHIPWQKEYDGIRYYGEAAMTHAEYKGAYGIIDLKKDTVEYLFAK